MDVIEHVWTVGSVTKKTVAIAAGAGIGGPDKPSHDVKKVYCPTRLLLGVA
jgi:hypothetical protein